MGLIVSIFSRSRNNDFEKKLEHLSKEEVMVHTRLKRRTQNWRKLARALIVYSVIGEVGSLSCFCRYLEGFPIVILSSNKNGCWKSIAKHKEFDEIRFRGGRRCFWG
jgi:hypothetical protein